MALDTTDKQQLKTFLASVYGQHVKGWAVNDKTFDLTYKLLNESRKCSDLMDLVPRPIPYGQSPIKWLSKEARKAILRKVNDSPKHYSACVKTSALKMKTQFIMSANGL